MSEPNSDTAMLREMLSASRAFEEWSLTRDVAHETEQDVFNAGWQAALLALIHSDQIRLVVAR